RYTDVCASRTEFLTNVDCINVILQLTKEQIGAIVHVLMKDVHTRLAEEGLHMTLTENALNYLVDKGYDEKFGARPLRRAIQRYVEDPLSEKILVGDLPSGEELEVDVNTAGDGLEFRVLSTKT